MDHDKHRGLGQTRVAHAGLVSGKMGIMNTEMPFGALTVGDGTSKGLRWVCKFAGGTGEVPSIVKQIMDDKFQVPNRRRQFALIFFFCEYHSLANSRLL